MPHNRLINSVIDFDTSKHKFLIFENDSISYTENWYGPPDPKPTPNGKTHKYLSVTGFETEEEVKDYLMKHNYDPSSSKLKIVKLEKFLSVTKSISFSL